VPRRSAGISNIWNLHKKMGKKKKFHRGRQVRREGTCTDRKSMTGGFGGLKLRQKSVVGSHGRRKNCTAVVPGGVADIVEKFSGGADRLVQEKGVRERNRKGP